MLLMAIHNAVPGWRVLATTYEQMDNNNDNDK